MKKGKILTIRGICTLLSIGMFAGYSFHAQSAKAMESPGLHAGGSVYLRIKEYVSKPIEDAKPKGIEVKFTFGENVKLIQKKDDLPTLWLVSKEQSQAWIPAYLLTANKAEIDFFKKNNRIPQTMTFIYVKDDIVKVWGIVRMGFFVVDSQGMAASAEGSSQVAFKGNAILFDESSVKYSWKNPMVFSKGKEAYKLTSNRIYYCVSKDEDGKASFDCIDLRKLTFCKE